MNLAIKTMLYEISGEAHFYQNFLLYTTGYGGMSKMTGAFSPSWQPYF